MPAGRGATASGVCGADGTEGVSVRDGSVSATSSVLNFPGHKDEVICRWMAEKVSGELNRRVICTGGFHKDGISAEEIREVQESVGRFDRVCDKKIAGVVCGFGLVYRGGSRAEGVGAERTPGRQYLSGSAASSGAGF